jgi:hypothetical protein
MFLQLLGTAFSIVRAGAYLSRQDEERRQLELEAEESRRSMGSTCRFATLEELL